MEQEIKAPLSMLGLSARTHYRLKPLYRHIEQLEHVSDAELLAIHNFGPAMLKEVRARLVDFHATKQGEALPDMFYVADRDRAKAGLAPLSLAYMERLEAIAQLADSYWTKTQLFPMSPEQYALSEALLDALSVVNFLAEQDTIEDEDAEREETEQGEELPRDVIFR